MKAICIIPARGGSKRIPKKNIRDFCGKPIIAYSIDVAIKSDLFDEVMVSTDCQEIAEVAIKYGAKVPFLRSIEASADNVHQVGAVREVLKKYNQKFDRACCMYAIAPLIRVDHLEQAYKMLDEYLSVFPVVKYNLPLEWALKVSNGQVKMIQEGMFQKQSYEFEDAYYPVGEWTFFRPEVLDSQDMRYNNNAGCIVFKPAEVQDIDIEEDWQMAEIKYELLRRKNGI